MGKNWTNARAWADEKIGGRGLFGT